MTNKSGSEFGCRANKLGKTQKVLDQDKNFGAAQQVWVNLKKYWGRAKLEGNKFWNRTKTSR